jgi:DNA (cytosine-5)-methyltransferase 1
MNYLSVCSGIEAATVAWHPLGWNPVGFGEIEKFPSQVLAHHYPKVPNFGDMTKFKEWQIESDVDVLVGGTPCQSFSVAGLRKGLDDPRGNLMLTYLAIAAKYRPKWLVWENVPGVLSSNGGHDFASLLRGMGELGYGFAYRVLDAQYFGVAQRRRRVFVVGYLGNWQRAAAVLFERYSLCGYPAPSREKGEVTPTLTKEGTGVSRTGHNEDGWYLETKATNAWPAAITNTLDTTFGAKMGLENQHVNAGCPMFVPAVANTLGASPSCHSSPNVASGQGDVIAFDVFNQDLIGQVSKTVASRNDQDTASCIAIAESTIGRQPQNGGNGDGFTDGGPMYTLNATGVHGVVQTMSFPWQSALDPIGKPTDLSGTLIKNQTPAVMHAMAVRRLTPTECERLQGFPDGYTDIKHGGKSTPDGPRYKALGNSMAVPVMAWIGKRIQQVEAIHAP